MLIKITQPGVMLAIEGVTTEVKPGTIVKVANPEKDDKGAAKMPGLFVGKAQVFDEDRLSEKDDVVQYTIVPKGLIGRVEAARAQADESESASKAALDDMTKERDEALQAKDKAEAALDDMTKERDEVIKAVKDPEGAAFVLYGELRDRIMATKGAAAASKELVAELQAEIDAETTPAAA